MIQRIAFTLALIVLSFCIHAQVRFAFFAGGQATSARYLVNEIKQPSQFKYGAMGGVAVKVDFENQLYFFPSIYYSQKGYKVTLNNPSFPPTEYAKNNNTTIQTIEIAPLFQIDFNKKPSHPFVRFGPAVDFAFNGHERFDTVSTTGSKATISRPMIFSFGDYGRITAQACLHLGFETEKGLMVFAFYEHGIGSMNNADGGPRILHRIVGLSLGWIIRKNPLVFDTKTKQ